MSRWLLPMLLWLGCLPDGTIDLLPDAGSPAGAGGAGAAGGEGGHPVTGGAGGGQGGCGAGLLDCDGACVDPHADPAHCGGCTAPCAVGEFCHQGGCACLPGMVMCDGACRDVASDPDHCGGCTAPPCPAGHKCEAGSCTSGDCSAGLTHCPWPGDRVACVNLALGYPRCGSCDVTCAATEVCVGFHCQAYQPASPCTACPCDSCDSALGGSAACCDHVYGSDVPMCVADGVCP